MSARLLCAGLVSVFVVAAGQPVLAGTAQQAYCDPGWRLEIIKGDAAPDMAVCVQRGDLTQVHYVGYDPCPGATASDEMAKEAANGRDRCPSAAAQGSTAPAPCPPDFLLRIVKAAPDQCFKTVTRQDSVIKARDVRQRKRSFSSEIKTIAASARPPKAAGQRTVAARCAAGWRMVKRGRYVACLKYGTVSRETGTEYLTPCSFPASWAEAPDGHDICLDDGKRYTVTPCPGPNPRREIVRGGLDRCFKVWKYLRPVEARDVEFTTKRWPETVEIHN